MSAAVASEPCPDARGPALTLQLTFMNLRPEPIAAAAPIYSSLPAGSFLPSYPYLVSVQVRPAAEHALQRWHSCVGSHCYC